MHVSGFQPSFDELSAPLHSVEFCVLDLETTGGSPSTCQITEIGAVKYRGGELLGTFQTLVDPGLEIPPSIVLLTGITQAMVVDAPQIETALPTFLEFIGDAVIVGHNVRFDLSFLNAAAIRLGYGKLENQSSDTARLARRLIRQEVRNLKLSSLAAHFRSPTKPNHRALEDAKATAHVFHCLLERAGSIGVTNLDDLVALPSARGSSYYSKIGLTDHLSREPGVYLFKDRQGTVIYIGKASNLRMRVRQYFYGDTRRSIANLMRELESVETIHCANSLEAEVTELRLIHAHRPRHNRRSKPPKSSHYVKVTKEKFPRLSVVRSLRSDALAYVGPFRSKRAADLVVQALWDAIPIRRCRGSSGSQTGKCAAAQIGRSLCPCDGLVGRSEYAGVVNALLEGLESAPHILLEPLIERMERLSGEQRYEEAAWARDRHDALATALNRSARWRTLHGAGLLRLEDRDGFIVTVDHGRLVGVERGASRESVDEPLQSEEGDHRVAPSVELSEEVDLIWRWIEKTSPAVLSSTDAFDPVIPELRRLSAIRQRAA